MDISRDRWIFVVGSTTILEIVYWTYNLFLHFIVYRSPWFDAYKLQKNKPRAPTQALSTVLNDVLISHFIVRPLLFFFFYDLVKACGVSFDFDQVPTAYTVLWQIFLCMQIDDTLFYWGHYALHSELLYKRIHKQHHMYQQPVGWVTEWAHPVEDMWNSVATVAGPLILGSHVAVMWLYVVIKLWQSIDAHCGYSLPFPLSPWSVLPWMDCAPAHDFHHENFKGNYGGFFMFWDTVMGTDKQYRLRQKKAVNQTPGPR
eukprot:TRINITY_DN67363_c1_g6_i1.p1 TRINITY_DN67363_c1_g6~~TRINITY_DN67363_c1_g6_i1.p1  ORF type:complete len:258 (-),score=-8.24 TRINITY_DN67363_c1_g6_i1:91-864(-)